MLGNNSFPAWKIDIINKKRVWDNRQEIGVYIE